MTSMSLPPGTAPIKRQYVFRACHCLRNGSPSVDSCYPLMPFLRLTMMQQKVQQLILEHHVRMWQILTRGARAAAKSGPRRKRRKSVVPTRAASLTRYMINLSYAGESPMGKYASMEMSSCFYSATSLDASYAV
jgi:hypothetical protein